MCDKNTKVNYIVREMQLSDCREVREIWESVGFPLHKHQPEVIMNIDPNAQYVAQDIDTGISLLIIEFQKLKSPKNRDDKLIV